MAGKKHPLLALALASLLLGGCCFGVYCDCFVAGLYVEYLDSAGNAEDLTQKGLVIETWTLPDSTLLQSDGGAGAVWDGTVYFNPEPGRYWVIRLDSVGLSDTVRLRSIATSNKKHGCCDCGPYIESIEYEVNGQAYTETHITRRY